MFVTARSRRKGSHSAYARFLVFSARTWLIGKDSKGSMAVDRERLKGADCGPTGVASGRTGVRAKAASHCEREMGFTHLRRSRLTSCAPSAPRAWAIASRRFRWSLPTRKASAVFFFRKDLASEHDRLTTLALSAITVRTGRGGGASYVVSSLHQNDPTSDPRTITTASATSAPTIATMKTSL